VADSGPAQFRGVHVFLHDRRSPTGYTEETLAPGDSGDPADSNYSTRAATLAIGNLGRDDRPVIAMTNSAFSDFEGSVSVFVKNVRDSGFTLSNVGLPASDASPVSIAAGRLARPRQGLDFVTANLFSGTLSLLTPTF
jgi:hypothetical protein